MQEAESAGVHYIHFDVMDGHFVPSLSMGPTILAAVRGSTSLPVDVHLMIEHPETQLEAYARAGASILTVHVEATRHLDQALRSIRDLGCQAGVALCPATPLSSVEEAVGQLDLLLIMTVNPGLGGQELLPHTIDKTARARQLLDRSQSKAALEVDGGITCRNAASLAAAGATVLVAGTSIFEADGGVAQGVRALQEALRKGAP